MQTNITGYLKILFIVILVMIPSFRLFALEVDDKGRIKGLMSVKFKNGSLTEVSNVLDINSIKNENLRSQLVNIGFIRGTKLFKNSQPGDTLAISRTGEWVFL